MHVLLPSNIQKSWVRAPNTGVQFGRLYVNYWDREHLRMQRVQFIGFGWQFLGCSAQFKKTALRQHKKINPNPKPNFVETKQIQLEKSEKPTKSKNESKISQETNQIQIPKWKKQPNPTIQNPNQGSCLDVIHDEG